MNNMVDSDGEQSDFKTTTLRFTNNNFINDGRRERDSSTGAANRDNSFHGHYINQPQGQSSLLNTLNSQNNSQVQQIGLQNRNKFGTSQNFKAGAHSVENTDGFNHGHKTQSKSPTNRQFSTMHAMMSS